MPESLASENAQKKDLPSNRQDGNAPAAGEGRGWSAYDVWVTRVRARNAPIVQKDVRAPTLVKEKNPF